MKKYIIPRHLINGEATLKEFEMNVGALNSAVDISSARNLGLEFGLKLTVDQRKLGKDLQERLKDTISKLPLTAWFLYDCQDRGPGTSSRQVLFSPTFIYEPSIVVCSCFDQFPIDSEDSLQHLSELAEKIEKDNCLYATGSRNVPVFLARYKRNSNLRIIHELFHSLTIGSDKLRVIPERSNTTPAYAKIGESTSGLHALNFAHQNYPVLREKLLKHSQRHDMNFGFTTAYYSAIKSSELGKLANGYVKAVKNKFYTERDKEEEFIAVQKLITGSTCRLGKTDVGGGLLSTLNDQENTDKISEFYPKDQVEFVRDLMLRSLNNQK